MKVLGVISQAEWGIEMARRSGNRRRSEYGYFEYVPVAEKKEKALKQLDRLRKKNPDIRPVIIEGRKLARAWWGQAWNTNLERYSDYENRLGRGRSYVRQGSILDLRIHPRKVSALVQGSMAKPYDIGINIRPLAQDVWDCLVKACEGKIDSLQELLEGKFPKSLSELFLAKGGGLFPAPREITFSCSCPDYAAMCKHVAAALYGVGTRLDEDPSLLFVLRGVNVGELITKAIDRKSDELLGKSGSSRRRIITGGDIGGMFGIELDQQASEQAREPERIRKSNQARESDQSRKTYRTQEPDQVQKPDRIQEPGQAPKKRGRPWKNPVVAFTAPNITRSAAKTASTVSAPSSGTKKRGRPRKTTI